MYIYIYTHTHKHHKMTHAKCITIHTRAIDRFPSSYVRKCNRLRPIDRTHFCHSYLPDDAQRPPTETLNFHHGVHVDSLALASFPRVDRSAIRLLIARRVVD